MIRRFALWLAEVTDSWARRLHDDTTGERLAVADDLEAWQVDCGTLVPRTDAQWREQMVRYDAFGTPPNIEARQRQHAMRRHPAGSRRT